MVNTWNNQTLLTDLYELTMAAAYFRYDMHEPATFSLFIRHYPPHRGYFVSAGLEDVLEFLENITFTSGDLEFLESLGYFSRTFLDYLSRFSFSGDVMAIPEGGVFFKDEPVIEVTAPIIEAQVAETFIINAMNFQVSVATKASRCVHAAQGRDLVDFSLRRTQGGDAGLKVARDSFIAGFSGTSNVLAGKSLGIPISGTMAHSFITSFDEEIDAFRAFSETFPDNTVLLIDTYDTIAGAGKAVTVAGEMAEKANTLKGVRLDSGDMAELSKNVRKILDENKLNNVKIVASGGFDEFKIAEILKRGACIDAFGVGTKMGVSADSPYTDMAYKLVRYHGKPTLKLSSGKKTLVDRKQVYRRKSNGRMKKDTIALRDEQLEGDPLLEPVMQNGRRLKEPEALEAAQKRFREQFEALGSRYKAIRQPASYPVRLSAQLETLQNQVVREVKIKELGES
jgi:nicotinate phosphoribosyltransferase